MPTREILPNRRASETFNLECAGLRYTATVLFAVSDGRPAEIFLANHKAGSQSDGNARDSAVAASLAFQYGCPLEVLCRSVLRNPDGTAATPLGTAVDIIASWGQP